MYLGRVMITTNFDPNWKTTTEHISKGFIFILGYVCEVVFLLHRSPAMETNRNINSSSPPPPPSTINSPLKPPKHYSTTVCPAPATELQKALANRRHHHQQQSNNVIDEYWKKFPVGYRFCPRDGELIVHYLRQKVLNQQLPRNKIVEVNIYLYNPEQLAENYKAFKEDDAYYFFTPRDRKSRNGERPSRAAGGGYWKATGANKPVKHQGGRVGSRNALVFYRGKPPNGTKTDWIMHEFKVDNPPPTKTNGKNDMKLDDWVLCKIYYKPGRSGKVRAMEQEDHRQADNKCMVLGGGPQADNKCMVVAPPPSDIYPQQFTNSVGNGVGNKRKKEEEEEESEPLSEEDTWSFMNVDNSNYSFIQDYGFDPVEMIYNSDNYMNHFDDAIYDPSSDNLYDHDFLHEHKDFKF